MADMKKIFITGGTGFVGRSVVKHLLDKNHAVTMLVRDKSRVPEQSSNDNRVRFHQGDISDSDSLKDALPGHDAVINLVGIIRENRSKGVTFENVHVDGTRNIVKASIDAGIRRFIQMSALGAGVNAKAEYHKTKYKAEEIVKQSGLDYTILRPSIIAGKDGEFINMLADMIRKFRSFPMIGGGNSLMQPVMVDDLAEGIARIIDSPVAFGKTYEIGGSKKYKFKEIVQIIADSIDVKVIMPSVPVAMMMPFVNVLQNQSWFPLTPDQLSMLLEDNITDSTSFFDDSGITQSDFKLAMVEIFGKEHR